MRRPQCAAEADELARLIAESEADARAQRRGRALEAPRKRHGTLDEEHQTALGVSLRLAGAELVDHVLWAARRELGAARGRPVLDEELARLRRLALVDAGERSARAARLELEAEGGAILDELSAAAERARGFLERRGSTSSLAGHRLDNVLRHLEAAAAADGTTRRQRALARPWLAMFGPPVYRRPPVLAPHGHRRARPAAPRTELARRIDSVARLLGLEALTDRQLALASLLAGNWPPDVEPDEAIAPTEVVVLERRAMRKARQRAGVTRRRT